MAFEMMETESKGTVIKVIGVGGAGGNAVEHMIRRGVQGVDFIVANTDRQALKRANAKQLIQLGKTGLGAGAKPEAGRQAAEEMRERIADALRGAHMVFITAGMGGGTGTGAAPVVAEIAKDMGILTVAVVSKPFDFEGPKRGRVADAGLAELEGKVHSLIVILNNKLEEVLGEDAEMGECFRAADDVLHNACAGIAEIINVEGMINVDFEDVKTVMSEQGKAMMGTATASGTDRARVAAEQAVASPLLEGVDLSGARGILVNITATTSLKMKETREVMTTIRAFAADDATVILGAVTDETMGDALRVTVVATGLGRAANRKPSPVTLVRTGTDNLPMAVGQIPALNTGASFSSGLLGNGQALAAGLSASMSGSSGAVNAVANTAAHGHAAAGDYSHLDTPAVWRSRDGAAARAAALDDMSTERFEIPAFLRKQAD